MKRVPPMSPMTFSDKYLATTAPPETAIPVAAAWAAIAPAATLTGFCAADKAMVDKKDLSPNSAANTKPNILKIRALLFDMVRSFEKKEGKYRESEGAV